MADVDSYYSRTRTETRDYPPLDGDLDVETLVIGGGLAGCATALDLAERGHSVALIEAERIGWGASGRNGGFASEIFPNGGEALVDRVGLSRAREFQAIASHGLALVRKRITDYGIDCGPVQTGALKCNIATKSEDLRKTQAYMADKFGLTYDYWPADKLRDALSTTQYSDALFVPSTLALHPLNLTCGLARAGAERGVKLFERTPALDLKTGPGRKTVRTARGTIRADRIVITCGGYINGLQSAISGATVPIATFVMATERLGERLKDAIRVPYAIFDNTVAVNYYRPLADTRLLWGGRVLAWQPDPKRIAALLRRDMVKFYPALAEAHVEVAWGGMMPFTRHKMPVIGQIEPDVWYATGFGGLGVSLTSAVGNVIAKAIVEGDETWTLFEAFGLPYAGGKLGKIPAQMIYWTHQMKAAAGFPSTH
ncbi:NAD(P)/FAD-dependent oxidoreductase [Lichenihabitans psoromatis]|uniref:NAD(P)/FAD-dependent oxidoreductase n=1 Tax=Lichenihabitans psoromatis TaxID=2528642 RepID=UPI00103663D8|nr:FAD-binding oxidoreductase [Lichenihabitans psoromatis]